MEITTIGVDLAKNVFQVHGVDERGKTVLRKQLRREQMVEFFAKLPPCLIGMEACGSAHHWARKLQGSGHTVRVIAPQFVKPYVKTQQERCRGCGGDLRSGGATEHALCAGQEHRAAGRAGGASGASGIREGAHGAGQPDSRAADRIRAGHPARHVATSHQRVPALLEDGRARLPLALRHLIERLLGQLKELDRQVAELEAQIQAWHRSSELSRRLEKIPGIGALTASALVASIADAQQLRQRPAAGRLVGAGTATAVPAVASRRCWA